MKRMNQGHAVGVGWEDFGDSMKKPIIAPSLFGARSSNYGQAIADVEQAGAQYLHIDIMDGHFVPNLSFGPNIVAGVRDLSSLYFDVHLMIENPERYALSFIQAGADCITIHGEARGDIDAVIQICNENGAGFGLALKPMTALDEFKQYYTRCKILLIMSIEPGFGGLKFMPDAIERIAQARQIREETGAEFKISVDGGINPTTASLCVSAGVDILVAGSAVFNSDDPAKVISQLMGV